MSIEREILKRIVNYGDFISPHFIYEINELLAQPEESVHQKLLRIEDNVEVEMLPSELWLDGYESGKRSSLLSKQPEQDNIQYLLDQVARLTAENAMLKEKWSTSKQPEQNKAGAVMPNGVCVSNVYDAYEEGRKSVMVEQEPIGYLYKQKDCYGEWATIFKVDKPYITWHDIKDIIPVYTAPPKREPLINIYVLNAFKADDEATHPYSYWAGVEFAEKHHGIGGEE